MADGDVLKMRTAACSRLRQAERVLLIPDEILLHSEFILRSLDVLETMRLPGVRRYCGLHTVATYCQDVGEIPKRALSGGCIRLDGRNRQCSAHQASPVALCTLTLAVTHLPPSAENAIQLHQKDDSARDTIGKLLWRRSRQKRASLHMLRHLDTSDTSTIRLS